MSNTAGPLDFVTIADTDLEKVLAILNEQGIVIIPDYLSPEELEALRKDFDHAIDKVVYRDGLKGCVNRGDETIEALGIRREDADVTELPTILKVFSNPFMEELKNRYLGEAADFNGYLYLGKDVVGSRSEANDLHFDVVPALKFFLYLSDTTVENGAFSCIPGTNRETMKIREKYGNKISYKNRQLSRIQDRDDEVIPVEQKAGALIIFTTEVWHKAGTVTSGERPIVRGQCQLPESQGGGVKKLVRKLFAK